MSSIKRLTGEKGVVTFPSSSVVNSAEECLLGAFLLLLLQKTVKSLPVVVTIPARKNDHLILAMPPTLLDTSGLVHPRYSCHDGYKHGT